MNLRLLLFPVLAVGTIALVLLLALGRPKP